MLAVSNALLPLQKEVAPVTVILACGEVFAVTATGAEVAEQDVPADTVTV